MKKIPTDFSIISLFWDALNKQSDFGTSILVSYSLRIGKKNPNGSISGCFSSYCWWKKSCTTWDVQNPVNYEITYLSTGAGFLPSTVSLIYIVQFNFCCFALYLLKIWVVKLEYKPWDVLIGAATARYLPLILEESLQNKKTPFHVCIIYIYIS